MNTIVATYSSRESEIKKLLSTMKFLEQMEQVRDDSGESSFAKFFKSEELGLLSYQELINILKSNISLMIYNLMEYTVANLVECIYSRIKMEGLSYVDINEGIQEIWRKITLKTLKDPNAVHSTVIKKNEEIINSIVNKATIELNYRDVISAGNLDGEAIKRTFERHGLKINTNNYRPFTLSAIKNKRNELAHGAVSFVDALRDKSLADIENDFGVINYFLQDLMKETDGYIHKKMYKCNELT